MLRLMSSASRAGSGEIDAGFAHTCALMHGGRRQVLGMELWPARERLADGIQHEAGRRASALKLTLG